MSNLYQQDLLENEDQDSQQQQQQQDQTEEEQIIQQLEEDVPNCLKGRGMCYASIAAIIFSMLLIGGGVVGCIKLFSHLDFADFHPQPGSLLEQSHQYRWSSNHQGFINSQPEYVVLKTTDGSSWHSDTRATQLYLLTISLELALQQHPSIDNIIPRIRCFYCDCYQNNTLISGPNNDTTVFEFVYLDWRRDPFVSDAEKWLSELQSTLLEGVSWKISGIIHLQRALTKNTLPNLGDIDRIAVPVSLLIFCLAVRSVSSVIVPVLSIICAVVPAFGIMGFISKEKSDGGSTTNSDSGGLMTVTGFAPEIAGSIAIGLSLDFALFAFARLREVDAENKIASRFLKRFSANSNSSSDDNKNTEKNIRRAVAVSQTWAAMSKVSHNIFISSISIAIAFGVLVFLPTDFVKSIALSCCLCTIFCLISSNTILPALIYFLYPFCFEECCCSYCNDNGNNSSSQTNFGNQIDDDDNSTPNDINYNTNTSANRSGNMNSNNNNSLSDSQSLLVLGRENKNENENQEEDDEEHDDLLLAASSPLTRQESKQGFYYKLASFSSKYAILVLFLAICVSAASTYVIVTKFSYDCNYLASAPHTIEAFHSYTEAIDVFGNIIDSPFYLLLHSHQINNEAQIPILHMQQSLFDVLNFAVNETEKYFDVSISDPVSLVSPNLFKGKLLTFEESQRLMNISTTTASTPSSTPTLKEMQEYGSMLKYLSGSDYPTSKNYVIAIRPRGKKYHPTWGARGADMLDSLEKLVEKVRAFAYNKTANRTVTFFNEWTWTNQTVSLEQALFVGFLGPNDSTWSVEKRVMKDLKLVVILTVSALFVVVLILLRSIFFAFVTIITMAFSVLCAFAFVTSVFAYSWLKQIYPLEFIDGYYWIISLLCFCVSCVLSLDYSVFLLVRTLEFRMLGFSSEKSMIRACSRSGPVISIAALVFCISVGSLCGASSIMLTQFGLTIALSVLIDAFIVRPILVPALVALAPEAIVWFPRRVVDVA